MQRSQLISGALKQVLVLLGLALGIVTLRTVPGWAQPEPVALNASVASLLAQSQVAEQLDAPLTPTGDALFDRYAATVMQRVEDAPALTFINLLGDFASGEAIPSSAQLLSPYPALLPPEVVEQWEPEFGGDVRYWELGYFCAQQWGYSRTEVSDGPSPRFAEPADYLREAQRRGLATWNTLMLLYPFDRRLIEAELDKVHQVAITTSPEGRELFIEKNRWAEQAELDLLNTAVNAAPDQAWPLFMRARFHSFLGDWDLAVADLEAASAAPHACNPSPFPVGYVQEGILLGQPRGNVVVSGAITQGAAVLALPNYIRLKEMAKEAVLIELMGGDSVPLEAIHQFGCRLGECRPVVLIQALVGMVITMIPLNHIEDVYPEELTPAQLDTVRRASRVQQDFRDAVRAANGELSVLMDEGARDSAPALGPYGTWILAYLGEEAYLRLFFTELEPKLELLRQVHIPELAASEELMQFEPLIPEEDEAS